jgi:gliding motility-associated-like protein
MTLERDDNLINLALVSTAADCGKSNGTIAAVATNGTQPYTFSLDGINFQQASLFSGLSPNTYTVTVRDAAGNSTTGTVVVESSVLTMQIQTTPASCFNKNGAISIAVSGGTSPFTYSIDNGTTTQTSRNFTGLDSGLYVAMATDMNGCVAREAVPLTALPTPKVYIGQDTVLCSGQILKLTVPQLPDYIYVWDDGSTNLFYPVSQTGAYSVKVTNQYGCYASTSINVIFKTTALFTLGNDTSMCKGSTVELQPSPKLNGVYLWSNGSTSTFLNVSSSGLYWLKVTNDGCEKTDTILVSYSPGPTITLGKDTAICEGQTLLLTAGSTDAQYTWQDGSNQPTFLVTAPGKYSVQAKKAGCESNSSIDVSSISIPAVNIGKNTTLCTDEKITLDATSPYSTYQWQDGSVDPVYIVSTAGTYRVEVSNSCGSTKDSIVVLYENCNCKFSVPNAFTPNGDGKNDLFLPKSPCKHDHYHLRIFNRWGQQVFETSNEGQGWDGTFNNQQASADGYVWFLEFQDGTTGKTINQQGSVVLVR